MNSREHPAPTPGEPRVEITLHRAAAGHPWRAEVVVDGRHLQFGSLLALIGWIARLEPQGGGIR